MALGLCPSGAAWARDDKRGPDFDHGSRNWESRKQKGDSAVHGPQSAVRLQHAVRAQRRRVECAADVSLRPVEPQRGRFFLTANRGLGPEPTEEANRSDLRHVAPKTLQKALWVVYTICGQPLQVVYFGWSRFQGPERARRKSRARATPCGPHRASGARCAMPVPSPLAARPRQGSRPPRCVIPWGRTSSHRVAYWSRPR